MKLKDFKEYKFKIKDFDKKDKLLKAALIEFGERSYDDASLNNILTNAGLSKGSFYYHFKNKQDLYLFLMSEVTNAKMDFMSKEVENYKESLENKNIFNVLRVYGHMGFKFAKTHPLYYQFAKKYLKEKNTEIKDIVKKNIEPVSTSFLEDLIKGAIARDEIRDVFSMDFTIRLFKYLFEDYDKVVFKDIDTHELDEILKFYDDYLDFIENGLGKK